MSPSLEERVKEMGPFTRLAFTKEWEEKLKKRSTRIETISLQDMLNIVSVEEKVVEKRELVGHYFLRLEVVRVGPKAYLEAKTMLASEGILKLVKQRLDQTEFETKKAILVEFFKERKTKI